MTAEISERHILSKKAEDVVFVIASSAIEGFAYDIKTVNLIIEKNNLSREEERVVKVLINLNVLPRNKKNVH